MRAVPAALSHRLGPAISTFAELGFDGTRIEDLTRATGVATSTLYYYFSGKQDVLAFLVRTWLDDVAAAVADAVGVPGSARDRLLGVVRTQLRLVRDNPDMCRVFFEELGRLAHRDDVAEQVHTSFHQPVEDLLREGAGDRSVRDVDPEAVAAAIHGAVMIAGRYYVAMGKLDEIDVAVEEIVGFVDGGLR